MITGGSETREPSGNKRGSERGVALLISLIVVTIVIMLIASTLYVITSSTTASGVGKKYATAAEAADGAIELTKDGIGLIFKKKSLPSIIPGTCEGESYNFEYALKNTAQPCTFSTVLPGTLGTQYTAKVTVEFVASGRLLGSRIEFPPRHAGGMAGGAALYYRINSVVKNNNDNTTAENSVLYRSTD